MREGQHHTVATADALGLHRASREILARQQIAPGGVGDMDTAGKSALEGVHLALQARLALVFVDITRLFEMRVQQAAEIQIQ